MAIPHSTTLTRALAEAAPRRTILTAVTSGLLAIRTFAHGGDSEARKNRKRNNNNNKNKNKNKNKRRNRKQKNRTVVRADATCSGASNAASSGDGGGRLAQTFTPGSSGHLVRAELLMEKKAGEDGDYVLRLSPIDSAGVPTNEILAETTVANGNVPVGQSIVAFTFAAPFFVVANTPYALVLTQPGGDRFTWNAISDDPCLGEPFVSTSQTGQFFENLGDFIFTTFVRS